jgi:glyoxylase-like metal-dependent hydrolase (beta-lactamase superfamily II)
MHDKNRSPASVVPRLREKKIVVGPFQCNCRILACPETGEAAVIDPGDEAPRILRAVGELSEELGRPVQVKYLLHTHGHLDHIAATRGVRELLGASAEAAPTPAPRILLHRADEELYLALARQAALFGLRYGDPLPVDAHLEHEEELRLGKLRLTVVHTPGHSPGSVCLRLHEDSRLGVPESLFSGDTLFEGSVGRTDLWGADGPLMFRMLRERVLSLDDSTRVCPGHGSDTAIGVERRTNPFLT